MLVREREREESKQGTVSHASERERVESNLSNKEKASHSSE